MASTPICLEGMALEALEALPHPLWAFDRETLKFVWANDVALEWLGYPRDALFSKTIVELRPPEYQQAIAEAAANFKDVAADAGTWPFITASGELLSAAVHWRRAFHNGREAVLASVRDLTELARVQREREALQKENTKLQVRGGLTPQHFQRLFEGAPGKFLVLSPDDFEIVAATEAYAAATNMKRQDLIGRHIFDVFPENPHDPDADGASAMRESLRRVRQLNTSDATSVLRYPIHRPDGTFEDRYLTAVNSPVPGPNGELSYIIHRIEDLTALYIKPATDGEAEQAPVVNDVMSQTLELRHALTRLRELEVRLRIGQRLLEFGAWDYDFATRQISWSDRIFQIHGMDPSEGAPDFDSYVSMIHPEDREEMLERFTKFANGIVPDLELQHRIRRPDGSYRYIKAVGERHNKYGRDIIVGLGQDVTSIFETQENLLQMERLWNLAGAKARLGGWRVRLSDSHLTWTRETAAIHEVPYDEPPTLEEAFAFYTPETVGIVADAFSRCVEKGETYDIIAQIVTRSGKKLWVRSMGEPEYDGAGKIIGAQGGFQDVTELVEARERGEELQQRLTSTLENMGDAFYLLSPEYEFLFLNKQAEKLLRRSRDELLGKYIWEAFPESRSNFLNAIPADADPEKELSFEFFYEPFDAWFEVELYPVPEGIAVYFRDITRERAQSMQLRLLEAAVERLNDVVMITDATPVDTGEGPRIVYVNDAFEQRTGYSRAEVTGKSPRILQGPGTDRQVLDRIRQALQQWQPVRAELLNYTKAGEAFWLEIDIVPITNEKGENTHWVSIERDVTERHVLEERLRESQKLEAMGRLTGGVAHDFNNLLTVILGNAELLSARLARDPQLRPLAEMTAKAAERGAELTSRLLAFARRQALQPKTIDSNKLIASIEPMLRRTISEEIELEFVRGAGLWAAEADPSQLEVALLNLVINARDAMPEGGKLTLETGNAHLDDTYAALHDEVKPGQYVMISVSDTGTGMTPETLARAFEPFYTTKEVGQGSGLGLSMVFGFVKQSGGHVKIYSEPDHGTSVKLYFPRARTAQEPAPPKAPRETILRGSEHILVVEDDDLVREHLSAQLEGLGYKVTSATNGPRALNIIREREDIALLLTDIVMPGGMNGRELADEAVKLRPDLKVLFSSGYSENAIVHHGRLDAGVELLSKPYRLQELAAKVRKVLDSTG
ncbi:MAG: PAS domain S-box protein [Pseudomonadota bacterium]